MYFVAINATEKTIQVSNRNMIMKHVWATGYDFGWELFTNTPAFDGHWNQ